MDKLTRAGILARIPESSFFEMRGPFGSFDVRIAIDPAFACPDCGKQIRIMLKPGIEEPLFFCIHCSGYMANIVQALHEETELQQAPGFEGMIDAFQGIFGPRSEWWDRPVLLAV